MFFSTFKITHIATVLALLFYYKYIIFCIKDILWIKQILCVCVSWLENWTTIYDIISKHKYMLSAKRLA